MSSFHTNYCTFFAWSNLLTEANGEVVQANQSSLLASYLLKAVLEGVTIFLSMMLKKALVWYCCPTTVQRDHSKNFIKHQFLLQVTQTETKYFIPSTYKKLVTLLIQTVYSSYVAYKTRAQHKRPVIYSRSNPNNGFTQSVSFHHKRVDLMNWMSTHC